MTDQAVGRIYSLSDPRDSIVRYIGQTTKTLEERLAGHVSSPARKVAPWIAELKEVGLAPLITALREGVPQNELLAAERAEITRRVVAGEPLLNEASTAAGRRIVEHNEAELASQLREQAWATMAHAAREALGGPLPPGALAPQELPHSLRAALQNLQAIEGAPEESALPAGLAKQMRLMSARHRVTEDMWRIFRDRWARLRRVDDGLDFHLQVLVSQVAQQPWKEASATSRYLSLIPWAVCAVAPWTALAERGGLPLEAEPFTAWAADDSEVSSALSDLGSYWPGIFKALAARESPNDRWHASAYLAAAVAAHDAAEVPAAAVPGIKAVLRQVAGDKMLTPAMATLLASLDPTALGDIFGPDLAHSADVQLGLPPGTAAQVLRFVLEHKGAGHFGTLDRVVARAAQELPSIQYPDYSTWSGRGVPAARAITVSLAKAGFVDLPSGLSKDQVMQEVRAMWS